MIALSDKYELVLNLTNAIEQYCFDAGVCHLLHILIDDGNYDDKSLLFLENELNNIDNKDYFWHLQKSLLMIYQSEPIESRNYLLYGMAD